MERAGLGDERGVERMMPRFLARLVADVGGYFWLPCPACGKHFGGQEWHRANGHADSIPDPNRETGYSLGICPDCTAAGRGCAAHAAASGLPWHGCDPEHDALAARS